MPAHDDEAPGWDAIDAALAHLYGGHRPTFHLATDLQKRVLFGCPEALDGISVFASQAPAHWHLVTYGLSELYSNESADPEWSGWGLELTLRVPRTDDECPTWAVGLLQRLASSMHAAQRPYKPGDRIDAGGPISQAVPRALRAFLLADDPDLGVINTPHGHLRFLQVVAVTAPELALAKQTSSADVLERLRARDPRLLVDLHRNWSVAVGG
jgi:hypothetical protein